MTDETTRGEPGNGQPTASQTVTHHAQVTHEGEPSRAGWKRACGNCGVEDTMAVMDARSSEETSLLAVDGSALEGAVSGPVRATRVLCASCGVIETVYEPGDLLRRFLRDTPEFAAHSDRDVVVKSGAVHRKRSVLHGRVIQFCLEDFAPDKPGAMLEIGAGEGHLTRRFAHQFQSWRVIGVDPSPVMASDWPPAPGRPGFLRDFFDPQLFSGQTFNVVVAHGILNRAAPWAMLKSLRALCEDGALVSLEVQVLDDALTAAQVWDAPWAFTRAALTRWLEAAGFDVVSTEDCMITAHVIVRARAGFDASATDEAQALHAPEEAGRALEFYTAQARWWQKVLVRAARARDVVRARGQAVALYGADVFSAVLMRALSDLNPVMIIDDLRAGQPFNGRPVVKRGEAAGRALSVLLCVHPEHQPLARAALERAGLEVIDLIDDGPLSMVPGEDVTVPGVQPRRV